MINANKNKNFDKKIKVVIAGSGLSGATIANILANNGYEVEIFEKRNHYGGNVYDKYQNNVLIHQYGPHIFHTSNEEVYSFMNNFWTLNSFRNKVEGIVKGKLVPIPFNFKSIDLCFPLESKEIKEKLLIFYPNQETITILELKKNTDPLINKLANFVYENVFLNYTQKMWGLKPEEIDESVTARIPLILSYRDTYFNDKYEGLPIEGYTKTISKMLNSPLIKLNLNSNIKDYLQVDKNKKRICFNNECKCIIVYSGSLDELFDYKFGVLDYRSLEFEFENINKKNYQTQAVINYPSDPKMTRITEYKKMTLQDNVLNTVISKEFPGKYDKDGKKWNVPYYPIDTEETKKKYLQYFNLAKQYQNLFLVGRLATYKYLNMDQAILQALNLSKEILKYLKEIEKNE